MKLRNGEEVRLTFNLYSLIEIEKEFGGITKLDDIFDDEKTLLQNVLTMLMIGANTTILLDNEDRGENKPLYTKRKLALSITLTDLASLQAEIMEAMTESQKQTFEVESDDTKK